MNNLSKICKYVMLINKRCGDFSGRSAVCCKCIYATKKHEGMRLKRLAKANVVEEVIAIPV